MAATLQAQIAHVAKHAAPMAPRPNGVDDTETIEWASAKRVPLRPGAVYVYKGRGIDSPHPYIVGSDTVIINQSSSGYVIDSNQMWEQLDVHNVQVDGGHGAIRNRFMGWNVTGKHRVTGCRFRLFTKCAISHNSMDMPYWEIHGNEFRAATDVGTIGVALSGMTDHCHITGNAFLNEQYSIKLAPQTVDGDERCPANTMIELNDFIHFSGGGVQKRANIWLVPKGVTLPKDDAWRANVDAHSGHVISRNKYGGENQQVHDVRMLIAAEDPATGADAGTKLPALAPTYGFVNGIVFEHNNIGGMAEGVEHVVECWTPNLVSSIFGHTQFSGSFPAEFLHFAGEAPTKLAEVTIGPFTRQWNSASQVMKAANVGLDHLWVETRNQTDPANMWPL